MKTRRGGNGKERVEVKSRGGMEVGGGGKGQRNGEETKSEDVISYQRSATSIAT